MNPRCLKCTIERQSIRILFPVLFFPYKTWNQEIPYINEMTT